MVNQDFWMKEIILMSPLVVSLLQAVDIIMYQPICVWMGLLGSVWKKNILSSLKLSDDLSV